VIAGEGGRLSNAELIIVNDLFPTFIYYHKFKNKNGYFLLKNETECFHQDKKIKFIANKEGLMKFF